MKGRLARGAMREGLAGGAIGLLAIVALAGAPGCGGAGAAEAAARGLVIVVQAPATGAAAWSPADFREPCPPGSRVAVWDPEERERPPRILSKGFESAGSPCVSPEGTHVIFCARRAPAERWRIYETPIRGGEAVAVSPEGTNAIGAAYLPDDRVVFSADLDGTLDPQDGKAAFSLYTAKRDGTGITRITFNPGSDIDPSVLDDGRILYAAWQPPGIGRTAGGWALFTVRNDGTGMFAFCGSHEKPSWKRSPRQVGRRVAYLAFDPAAGAAGLRTVALRRPLKSLREVGGAAGGSWRSGAAWDGEKLLASHRPAAGEGGGDRTFGLYLVGVEGEASVEPLLDDPELDEIDALRVDGPRRLRGIVSMVKPDQETGEFLCLDTRLSDLGESSGGDPASTAQVLVYRAQPVSKVGSPPASSPTADGTYALPTELVGTFPVAGDGSVRFEAPADTPIRFRTVDGNGQTILDSVGWVWVRPGERRGCIGCHADRELAPANRVPEAIAGKAPAAYAGRAMAEAGE